MGRGRKAIPRYLMKAINELLKETPQEYELTLFSLWLEWCQKKAHNQEQLQMLLSNNALFTWWRENLRTFERYFADDVSSYNGNLDRDTLKDIYRDYTSVIHKHYSKVLIKKALAI